MNQFILVILQCLVVVLSANIKCGVPELVLSKRIVHGQDTELGEWPWQAAIYLRGSDPKSFRCGGTLISEWFVLTAAHCVSTVEGNKHASKNVFILLGVHNLRQVGGAQSHGIANSYRDPGYNPNTLENDIAMLKLASSAKYGLHIRPACLYTEDNLVGQRGTVIGWGFTEKNEISDVLQKASVPVVDHQTCLDRDWLSYGPLLKRKNICAGYTNGTTACNGDSGGGVFFERRGAWYLGGIVSLAIPRQERILICSTKYYTLYTKVSSYVPWISRVMRDETRQSKFTTSSNMSGSIRPRTTTTQRTTLQFVVFRTSTPSTTKQPTILIIPPVVPNAVNTGQQVSLSKPSSVLNHNRVVVCYIRSWVYYKGYTWEKFDPQLCTHAIYAFAGLDVEKNSIRPTDTFLDLKEHYGKGAYEKYVTLKHTSPHLKVLLAVGGSAEGSSKFSKIAANSASRQTFAKNALDFIQHHGFDGLDVDWEYPTKPGDRENFVLLIQELNKLFKKHNLLLTAVISPKKDVIDDAYDVSTLSKIVDHFHVTSYSYPMANGRNIQATSPLQSSGEFSVEMTVSQLISLGAPANKIVVGLPFYGTTFTTKDKITGVPSGTLDYRKICLKIKENPKDWDLTWDAQTSQVFATMRDGASTKIVIYDSSRSIANKVRFAVRRNLAGLMIWSADTDDFNGLCDPERDTYADFESTSTHQLVSAKDKYKLLRTVNNAIVLATMKDNI